MSTPIAITASKGCVDAAEDPAGVRLRAVRSLVEEPSKSPAPREEDVVDWIWEAAKSLASESVVYELVKVGKYTFGKQLVAPSCQVRIVQLCSLH